MLSRLLAGRNRRVFNRDVWATHANVIKLRPLAKIAGAFRSLACGDRVLSGYASLRSLGPFAPHGAPAILKVHDGQMTVSTFQTVLRELQDEIKRRAKPGGSAVDELLAERRAEAARE